MPKTTPFDKHSDQYEDWFVTYRNVFLSELSALRKVIPEEGTGIEIGVGSGIFAEPLGIRTGVEPSVKMRTRASERGIHAVDGVAEALPFPDNHFDFALMVTTICFVDDPHQSLREANRILTGSGVLVIGFVDKESPVGKNYLEYREESVFYRDAVFFSTGELIKMLEETGFGIGEIYQTVFGELD
ncbi:MAG TPA: class I SAM-dependent methyltransferase, partial [Bacteroides sp.]|nr:class I SAM-dependent methyltransferase [Bacteroides sp.]